jgi:hypothetical protein
MCSRTQNQPTVISIVNSAGNNYEQSNEDEVFVDASPTFDINYVDSHGLIEFSGQTSSNNEFPSSSAASFDTVDENDDLTFFSVEHHGIILFFYV